MGAFLCQDAATRPAALIVYNDRTSSMLGSLAPKFNIVAAVIPILVHISSSMEYNLLSCHEVIQKFFNLSHFDALHKFLYEPGASLCHAFVVFQPTPRLNPFDGKKYSDGGDE